METEKERAPGVNAEGPDSKEEVTSLATTTVAATVVHDKRSAEDHADDSPAGLIRFALINNASIEEMRELVGLQREMSAEMAKKAYHRDMAAARAEMTSTIQRRGYNQHTKSKYVLLCDLVEAYAPVLAKYGFNYSWVPDQTREKGWVYVTCVVTHRDGHSESYPLGAPEDNTGTGGKTNKTAVQGIGSTTSYLERYTFQAAFGVAASDTDNDGSPVGGQEQQEAIDPPHPNSIARLKALLEEAYSFEKTSGKTTKALRKGVNDALDSHAKGQLSKGFAGVIIGKAKASLTKAGWVEPPEWAEERKARNKAKRAAKSRDEEPPELDNDPGEPPLPDNDPGEPPESNDLQPVQGEFDVKPGREAAMDPGDIIKALEAHQKHAELFNNASAILEQYTHGGISKAHVLEEIAKMDEWIADEADRNF